MMRMSLVRIEGEMGGGGGEGDLGGGRDSPQRDLNGRFMRGNAGRPVGARNRVSGRVARLILRDFEAHQDELLPRMRRWFLPQYLQLVGRLLPRELAEGGEDGGAAEALSAADELSAAELARMLAEAHAATAREGADGQGFDELEVALRGRGARGGAP
jgi:hypothetical protein